jgi:hypothetical protein
MVGDLLRGQIRQAEKRLVFVFILGGHRLQVFSFEDLTAVQTLYIINAVTSCNDFSTVMVTPTN